MSGFRPVLSVHPRFSGDSVPGLQLNRQKENRNTYSLRYQTKKHVIRINPGQFLDSRSAGAVKNDLGVSELARETILPEKNTAFDAETIYKVNKRTAT